MDDTWKWTEEIRKVMFFPIEIIEFDEKKSYVCHINTDNISYFYFDGHRIRFFMNNGDSLASNKTFTSSKNAITYIEELLKSG